jgi:hypothetical protein
MPSCGEPHPDYPAILCSEDHVTPTPHLGFTEKYEPKAWPNEATEEFLALEIKKRSLGTKAGKSKLLLDLTQSTQEEKRVGAYERTTGLSSSTDGAVQLAGAERVAPVAGTHRAIILESFTGHPNGLTYEEICLIVEMNYSRVGPRVRELVTDGFLRDSGLVRTTSTGSSQIIWITV